LLSIHSTKRDELDEKSQAVEPLTTPGMAAENGPVETLEKTPADQNEDMPNNTPKKEAADGLLIYRASRPEEILRVRDISKEFHSECRYAHLPFSEEKFIRAYTRAIRNSNDTLAIYIQYKGETVGVLNAGVGDYYLGEGGRMVTIYVLYVSGKVRGTFLGGKVGVRLLRTVMDWATSQKAQEIHIHSTSGIEPKRTDKLLTRMGFVTYGGNYVARVG